MTRTIPKWGVVLLLAILIITSIGVRIRYMQFAMGDRDSPSFYGLEYRPRALISGGSSNDGRANDMFESTSFPTLQLF